MFHIYAISFFLAFKLYSLVAKKKQIALTARPTAPSPNTATVVPSFTLAVFHAAPTPIFTFNNYTKPTNLCCNILFAHSHG
jgi:hypothetical protein